ncbi:OmpA family protein [Lutibacter sp.]|uniref:OmpA family protein n=1 Tax=Lutibacter sp. TaxID=1925666 RepID=UPI00273728DD|nr:OmpA family protein [Lutibacter sp.]MDP3312046.1 OmpA family protein [Lutibacter sp.]
MKKIISIIVLGILALQLTAQVSEERKPSTLAFHVFYNDFNTAQQIKISSLNNVLKNHLWSKIGAMQTGFGINYLKGIRNKIDFVATLDGSWTDYLYDDGTSYGSNQFLLDANAALNFKMLTDRHTLVPYISSGVGVSLYQGKTGFYVPVGAGLQFNVFDEAFIFTNIQYRYALTSAVNDHFYYTIGIAISIGKNKVKPAEIVEPIIKEISNKNMVVSVYDEATGLPLANVEVTIGGADNQKRNAFTDADGKAIFSSIAPSDYSVSGLLNHINSSTQNIEKSAFETEENQINISLTHNDPKFTLKGVAINKTQNIPEGNVVIKITNDTKQTMVSEQSHSENGVFQTQLEAESDFTLVGKKANYISNIVKVSTKGLNRSATLFVNLELAIEEAKVGQSIVLNNIYFEVGKATVNTAFSTDLDKLIQFLKDNTETKLEIQGHSDNTGSLNLNNKLSQARANSIVDYLVKQGIDSLRLSAKGFGPSLPIADNTTADGRAKNRRVVIKVMQ